jgi:hypothetical protein
MKILTALLILFVFFANPLFGCAPILDTFTTRDVSDTCGWGRWGTIQITDYYVIKWSDNQITSSGASDFRGFGNCYGTTRCEPTITDKEYENNGATGAFSMLVTNKKLVGTGLNCVEDFATRKRVSHTCATGGGGGGGCRSGFTTCGEKFKEGDSSDLCSPCDPSPWELQDCENRGFQYDWSTCLCGGSPIVIDVLGNGFNLTNAASGVSFDINGNGVDEQIAWSSASSDDAWLALDRNENGSIDSGKELFGNFTRQPAPPAGEVKNGFLALAVFDEAANGGNDDGKINHNDAVFSSLRLWQDANHNGVSEASELKTLNQLGLATIDLDYQESRRTDENGNRFRFKARVRDAQDAQLGRWAWDVYLVVEP